MRVRASSLSPFESTKPSCLHAFTSTIKKMKLAFSSVSDKDLSNLGIERRSLVIKQDILTQRTQRLGDGAIHGGPIIRLCEKITRIYRFVSLRGGPGTRMILDAVLLTVAEVLADGDTKLPVAIYPSMRVASEEGIKVVNSATNIEMSLTGSVDYALCTYTDVSHRQRVLDSNVHGVIRFTRNRIILVGGKREGQQLHERMPEAITQAIALSEVARTNTLRFCLSDGQNWIFALLTKDEHGNRTCYEGEAFSIADPTVPTTESDDLQAFKNDVYTIVDLVRHWLVASGDPLNDSLYSLKAVGE